MALKLYLNRKEIGEISDNISYSSATVMEGQTNSVHVSENEPIYEITRFIAKNAGTATMGFTCLVEYTGDWAYPQTYMLGKANSFQGQSGRLETYDGTTYTLIHSNVACIGLGLTSVDAPQFKFKVNFTMGIEMSSNLLSNGDCQTVEGAGLLDWSGNVTYEQTTIKSEFGDSKLVGKSTDYCQYDFSGDVTLVADNIYKVSADVYLINDEATSITDNITLAIYESTGESVAVIFEVTSNKKTTLQYKFKADGDETDIQLGDISVTYPYLFNNVRLELV